MPTPPFLIVADVAARLLKTERWLKDHLRANPNGYKAGRTGLFTEADYEALLEGLACAPTRPRAVKPAIRKEVTSAQASGLIAERLKAKKDALKAENARRMPQTPVKVRKNGAAPR